MVKDPNLFKNGPVASVLKCIFIAVLGGYQLQCMCHLEENVPN